MAKSLLDYKSLVTGSSKSYKKVIAKSDGRILWKAGAVVTYMVDSGRSYAVEVENGASVLNPTSFIPEKDGWEFVGWRKDNVPSADIETDLVMGTEPIVLYAVYEKEVVANFYSGLSKAQHDEAKGKAYYNAYGNMVQGSVKAPTGKTVSNWTWRGWSTYNSYKADGDPAFANGASVLVHPDDSGKVSLYGLYQQNIKLSYDGNGADSGSVSAETKTRYHNSYGNYANPSFTLKANAFTRKNYNFSGWDLGAAGASVELSASTTAKAQWTMIPAQPFYLNMDMGVTFSNSVNTNGAVTGNTWPSADNPYWMLAVEHDGGGTWTNAVSTTSSFARKYCTKCKFNCFIATNAAYVSINGHATNLVAGENIIDISDYGDSLVMSLATGSTDETAQVQISAPYFY